MKTVHIKDKFGQEHDYIALKTIRDVMDYGAMLDEEVSNVVHKLVTSDIPVDKWDHLRMTGDGGGVFHGAMATAYVNESNPLFEIPALVSGKIKRFFDFIENGETVLVNENGGYCYFMPSYHTILSEREYVYSREDTSVVRSYTKYINLENDPKLEKHTIDYLSQKDKNFSYVLNLRNYNVEALTKIFRKFIENGGKVVYVYTTGIDVPQMFDYSEAIVAAGIKHVEFEFNAGENPRHADVISYLTERGVDVKVL